MVLNIKEGTQQRAQKVVIYGAEGIGKSTLASHFPDPLYIDLEDGTSQLNIKRINDVKSWEHFIEIMMEIIRTPDICKTLVIDTADAAEGLAVRYVCATNKINGIEGLGYGKGYVYLAEQMAAFLSSLDVLIRKGCNVVVLAHAQMRKFELPDELGTYDRWELKLQKKVAPLFKEWSDMLLFCNYKTDVLLTDNGAKAKGGKRVIYASHHPCWDAKNRHNLPDMFDMDYEHIRPIFEPAKTNIKEVSTNG